MTKIIQRSEATIPNDGATIKHDNLKDCKLKFSPTLIDPIKVRPIIGDSHGGRL